MKIEELNKFNSERQRLNEIVLNHGDKVLKRFFSLDTQCYKEGSLSCQTKELLGLVASLVLRCDDCITYHIDQCFKTGTTTEELSEALSVGLVVGGSITIPHVRRALETWDALLAENA